MLETFHCVSHTHKLFIPLKKEIHSTLNFCLHRNSRDVEVIDNNLPQTMRAFLNQFFSVVGTLVVIIYSTPIFVSLLVPIMIVYYITQVSLEWSMVARITSLLVKVHGRDLPILDLRVYVHFDACFKYTMYVRFWLILVTYRRHF